MPRTVFRRDYSIDWASLSSARIAHANALQFGSWLFAGLLAVLVLPGVTAGESVEDRSLSAMCRNGLSESAIRYVERQRFLAGDRPSEFARWTMRLMECHAQMGLRNFEQSAKAWEECEAIFTAFSETRAENARLPWVSWQRSRCQLLNAQAEYAKFLAVPGNDAPRDRALEVVRQIVVQLDTLEDDIKRRQPLAARQSVAGGAQAPADQLAQLSVDVGLLRCEALLIRARLYDTGSADRVAASTDVETQASEILKRTGADWASRDPLRVARAAALLNLGRSQEALAELTELAQTQKGMPVGQRSASIAINHLAQQGELSRAHALLPLISESSPEFRLASIQLSLAELGRLDETARQEQLTSLVDSARQIGATHGDYWRNRAEAMLTGSVSSEQLNGGSAATELMIVEVRQLLAAGNEAAAIAKLIQYRDTEAAAGRGEQAVDLALKAAALLERRKELLAAVDTIEPTAIRFPNAPGAAAAHARAIFNLSQLLRNDSQSAALSRRYETSLLTQQTTWPDADQTDETQQWLALWLQGKDRAAEYIDSVAGRGCRCQDQEVRRRVLSHWIALVASYPKESARHELIASFEKLREEQKLPQLDELAVAPVAVAPFAAWPSGDEATTIDQRLDRLRTSSDELKNSQILMAAILVRAAQRGDFAQAKRLSRTWDFSSLSMELRKSLSAGLVDAVAEASALDQAGWCQVLGLDKAFARELTADSETMTKALGYRILVWLKQRDEAIKGLTALTRREPRNGALKLHLASALGDAQRLDESDKALRRLIASSEPGSTLRLTARWRLMQNQITAGRPEEARKAARLLMAAQPPESELWKSRFQSLLE